MSFGALGHRSCVIVALLVLAACASESTDGTSNLDETLIRLVDPHDEPEFYCIDVPGWGASLDVDAPLTAHTCKPNADDELFVFDTPATGQVFMPAYDRCMQVLDATPNGDVSLGACSDSFSQRFTTPDDGTIRPADASGLCIGVSESAGEPTGGPSHLRRPLLLVSCAEHPASLTAWDLPGPFAD